MGVLGCFLFLFECCMFEFGTREKMLMFRSSIASCD